MLQQYMRQRYRTIGKSVGKNSQEATRRRLEFQGRLTHLFMRFNDPVICVRSLIFSHRICHLHTVEKRRCVKECSISGSGSKNVQ